MQSTGQSCGVFDRDATRPGTKEEEGTAAWVCSNWLANLAPKAHIHIMGDLLKQLANSPAMAYLVPFGGLGLVLNLALNFLHSRLAFSDRVWGIATLACGAIGGVLMQGVGLIAIASDGSLASHLLAAFVGAVTAAAAASFSPLDLRATVLKPKE